MSSHDLHVQEAVNEAVLHPPAMRIDVDGVLKGGRRRALRRNVAQAGISCLAVLFAVTAWFGLGNGADVTGLQTDPASRPTWDTSVAIHQPIRPHDSSSEEGIYGADISRAPGDEDFEITSTVDGVRETFEPVEADLPTGVELFAIGDDFLVVCPTFDGVAAQVVLEEGSRGGTGSWDLDTEGGALAFNVIEPSPGHQFEPSDVRDVVWMTPSTWWGRETQVSAASGRRVDRATLSLGSERIDVFILAELDVWGHLHDYPMLEGEIDPGATYWTASGADESLDRLVSFVPRGSTNIRVEAPEDITTDVAIAKAPVGDWIAVMSLGTSFADLLWTSPDGIDYDGIEPIQE